jgi:hypothetical protein
MLLMGITVCSAVLSTSAAIDALNRLSIASDPKGMAIPVPGVLMGNSSSSWIGIGAEIFPISQSAMNRRRRHSNDVSPLIEEPVFVLAGASDLHFPPLNLLMTEGPEVSPLACQAFTESAKLVLEARGKHLRTGS